MRSVRITIDLSKASGTKLALFQAIFRYSVPIYNWIYENSAKDFDPYPYFTLISPDFQAASKPCKRAEDRERTAMQGS